jgi:hypothetical protein
LIRAPSHPKEIGVDVSPALGGFRLIVLSEAAIVALA